MLTTAIRAILMIAVAATGMMLIQSDASARTISVKTCTNSQIREHVTDAFVISCTGKGGQVKCGAGGLVVCCKTDSSGKRVCARNPDNLPLTDNQPSRPPHVRTDPGPGRVSPPQNPRPPRASTPPGRIGPPTPTGPRVK